MSSGKPQSGSALSRDPPQYELLDGKERSGLRVIGYMGLDGLSYTGCAAMRRSCCGISSQEVAKARLKSGVSIWDGGIFAAGTKPHLRAAVLFKAVSSGQLRSLFLC